MIRYATPADAHRVWELICTLEECELDYLGFCRAYTEQQNDGRHAAFVWTDGGAHSDRILALLNMRIEQQLHHAGPIAEVQELVVSPELRGQGVGKQLLDRAVKEARRAGCLRLELVTNRRRVGAHRFYEREGMRQTHYGYTMDL